MAADRPEILLVEDTSSAFPFVCALEPRYAVQVLPERAGRDDVLAQAGKRMRALVTTTNKGADAALIAALPRLEIIANAGGHLDNLDLTSARARKIPVVYTPEVSIEDVADLAFGLLVGLARRIPEAERYLRAGRWHRGMMGFGTRVNRKRLGIVGLGRIGRAVARRARGFGMSVSYWGPRPKHDSEVRYVADGPAALASEVDFLMVTCKAGLETRHLIDARVIEALGPHGMLVSISRGAVDEDALIAALRKARIAGAALDTFANEPDVPAALLAIENVVLQPHAGSKTWETKRTMVARTVANLDAHFSGRPLPGPVL